MKKIIILILYTATSFVVSKPLYAKIWRVNNNGFAANFTTLLAANNSNLVANGDTVHLEGSQVRYAGTDINKKLIILGPGYFLNENPNTSNNTLEASIASIQFNTGSTGSQLIGVYIGNGNTAGIDINVSNILIKRCKIDYSVFINTATISNISIVQNFFVGLGTASAITYSSASFASDVIFSNNISQRPLILQSGYTLLECKNNVFDCPAFTNSPSIKIYASSFQNNILKNPAAIVDINGGSNQNVSYNIGASASQFGAGNNNIVVNDMTTLFVDASTNTSDGDYQIKTNSAGSNNGSDGTDRGAFGGSSPVSHYTLSGLAPIPVIYEITTTGVASGNLPVTIKARTVK